MDATPSAAREDLAGFLHDLPRGNHAMVHLEMPEMEALRACHATALDAGERWLVHESLPEPLPPELARDAVRFPHFTAATFQDLLDEALGKARGDDLPGAFLTILPERRMELLGPASHVASESALGPRVNQRLRVVCIYTREADVLAHSVRTDVEACHADVFTVVRDGEA